MKTQIFSIALLQVLNMQTNAISIKAGQCGDPEEEAVNIGDYLITRP